MRIDNWVLKIENLERKIEVREDWPNGEGVKQIASEVFVSFGSSQKNEEKCTYKALIIKESKK